MNKGITLLLLVAILGAMGLVLFFHSGSRDEGPQPLAENALPGTTPRIAPDGGGQASPLQSPQGDSGGLSRIDPPLSTPRPAPEGAPVPVTLGPDGKPPRQTPPPAPAQEKTPPAPQAGNETQKQPAAEAPKPETKPESKPEEPATPPVQSRPPSGAPGLTPWESPPRSDTGAATAQTPTPQTPSASSEPTRTPAAAAGQRLATDPIKPAAEPAGKGAHSLKGISLTPAGQGVRLRIEADSPFQCKTFVLTGPDRLVIDLPGSWSGMQKPQIPANSPVKNVRLGQQASGPRLVLDLNGALKNHRVERSGNTVDILVQ